MLVLMANDNLLEMAGVHNGRRVGTSRLSFIHVLREGKKRWSKVVSQAGFLLEGNRVRVSLLALS